MPNTPSFDDVLPSVALPYVEGRTAVVSRHLQTCNMETLAPEEDPSPPPLVLVDRYQDLGLLGAGGMGEVRRVRDMLLGRVVAMKLAHPKTTRTPLLAARFLEEAQIQSQLQHPGLVPVYDMGVLPDGRPWFTMREIKGQTLGALLHQGTRSLRRLCFSFQLACEAVAYAHALGIAHRDLKPDNILVGDFGEVLVVDWGLAKLGQGRDGLEALALLPSGRQMTLVGKVAGTPAYMPPEQANGGLAAADLRSDVYALGAILYEILCGRPPYVGADAAEILAQLRQGPPALLPAGLPEELVHICMTAMHRDPLQRFDSAARLAQLLKDWQEDLRRQERALAIVADAQKHYPAATVLRQEASILKQEAVTVLRGIQPWAADTEKAAGWAIEDQALRLERQATLLELEGDQLLDAALTHKQDLPEAHAALAGRARARHVLAELRRDQVRADRAEARLRRHALALPTDHPDRQRHLDYLSGMGALTLLTSVSADIILEQYQLQQRRLVAESFKQLSSPLLAFPLEMGSYRLRIRAPGCEEVLYPVMIGRQEHWDGVPPEGGASQAVFLPPLGSVPAGCCYVPAGWFQCGGDAEAHNGLVGRRVWVDGFVMQRFPVTNREYLVFLNDLLVQEREEEALLYAPRDRAGPIAPGAIQYARHADGFFDVGVDKDGWAWGLDMPVIMVDWYAAQAYARWLSARTGQSWRLPSELEWEKAARGVDGRVYPWGDIYDPSWVCTRLSHTGTPAPQNVFAFPADVSPYGIHDLGGNVREWTQSPWWDGGPPVVGGREVSGGADSDKHQRVVRGGGWDTGLVANIHAASRRGSVPSTLDSDIGFRLVCGLG